MATVTQFAPSQTSAFTFSAVLQGPTSNVTSAGDLFNVSVPWSVYGQRFYVTITDQDGNVVLNTPLIASADPPAQQFNMVSGYFTGSTMVFSENLQQFTVAP